MKHTIEEYRNGGEGFCLWAEDNAWISIYPKGKRIPEWYPLGGLPEEYSEIWEGQKEICKEALRMVDGNFIYTLIVFCWMRGEGKSLLVCLIQLWKFFCFPKQKITLGANSKDQTKFVHFDIMKDIINNSPNLIRIVGSKNVQERVVRLMDRHNNVVSTIHPISTASGIVSNITGYTFSEFFDMRNTKFFVQLDGSVRNIPNSLGLIDSTVSDKEHQLYVLYETWLEARGLTDEEAEEQEKDKTIFFSYRCSTLGDPKDYWNPYMSKKQLLSYKKKFPLGDFERYFLNTWDAGVRKIFTPELIECSRYLGANGVYGNNSEVAKLVERKLKIKGFADSGESKGIEFKDPGVLLNEIEKSLVPVESIYNLGSLSSGVQMISGADLNKLGALYDTAWVITAGFDRSDPMKTHPLARTIYTVVAKGLVGSLSNPFMGLEPNYVPKYIYFLINIQHLTNNSLDEMKRLLTESDKEYDGLDKICAERWGTFDLDPWCKDNGIEYEAVHPGYEKQKTAFSELFVLYRDQRFKTPIVPLRGQKMNDILEEEALVFDHDVSSRWFGSSEKHQKFGVQDDVMFSLAWCIWGSRTIGPEKLRERKVNLSFGEMLLGDGHLGSY